MRPYPKYKSSGIEWIGDIPEGWEVRKVARSFSIIGSGTTPNTSNLDYYLEGNVNWINSTDLSDNVINDCARKISDIALQNCSTLRIYPKGTLLIALYGATIGKIGITNLEGCTNQACCALVRSNFFEMKYVFYLLIANRNYLISLSYGGGQPNISQELIKSLRIPCPSMVEQRFVIDYLDHKTSRLNSLVSKKTELIELLKEERASIINQAVTKGLNPDVPMKDSGIPALSEVPVHWRIEKNKHIFREVNERSLSGEEELLTVSHITGVTPRAEKEVNMFLADTMEGYKVCRTDDLIINTMWAWMGALGITSYDGIVSPSYNVYRLKSKDKYHPKYLDLLFRTPHYECEIMRHSKGVWTSRLRLYPEYFFEMFTLTPPFVEQEKIAHVLGEETFRIESAISKIEKEISLLQEYRTALISEVVTGKIDVRSYNDASNEEDAKIFCQSLPRGDNSLVGEVCGDCHT